MVKNDFLDWERVIAAVEDGCIAGYCTFSERDELPEEYGFSPFIGFVFVAEQYRGRRVSERMISRACRYADEQGFRVVYVVSGESGLYEKYGFEKLGDYKTIYGTRDQLFRKELTETADNPDPKNTISCACAIPRAELEKLTDPGRKSRETVSGS